MANKLTIVMAGSAAQVVTIGVQGPQGPAGPLNAPVVLLASDGTPGTGPLKFVAGTELATPEEGVMEYTGKHLLLTTKASRHGISTANGVILSSTIVENTVVETEVYSRNFVADELHADQVVLFTLLGAYTNSSASDDFTVRIKINGVTAISFGRVGGNVTDAGIELAFWSTIRSDGMDGTFVSFAKMIDNGEVYTSAVSDEGDVNTIIDNTLSVTFQWDAQKAGNVFTASQSFVQFLH